MSYYHFNKKEELHKAKERILKKKLPSIIYKTKKQNKNQKIDTKTCQRKKKTRLKSIKKKRYQQLI